MKRRNHLVSNFPVRPSRLRTALQDEGSVPIDYDRMVRHLSRFIVMHRSTDVDGEPRYAGETDDKLAFVEIIGNRERISMATLLISTPVGDAHIDGRNAAMAIRFIKNANPGWRRAEAWMAAAFLQLARSPHRVFTVTKGYRQTRIAWLQEVGMIYITVEY